MNNLNKWPIFVLGDLSKYIDNDQELKKFEIFFKKSP